MREKKKGATKIGIISLSLEFHQFVYSLVLPLRSSIIALFATPFECMQNLLPLQITKKSIWTPETFAPKLQQRYKNAIPEIFGEKRYERNHSIFWALSRKS